MAMAHSKQYVSKTVYERIRTDIGATSHIPPMAYNLYKIEGM